MNIKLSVPNSQAQDSSIAGVYTDVKVGLKELLVSKENSSKSLLICSGGTSSRCAADGHWTLDLRQRYTRINYDHANENVEIDAGINMGALSKALGEHGRSFPIGLSGITGVGYILTGGIGPLSRFQGLAIDQILNIRGVLGNGEEFEISRPNLSSSSYDKSLWRGLCGAAPFLAVITKLKLQTHPILPIKTWEVKLNPEELSEIIKHAEIWPNYASLQWIWGDKIKAYGVLGLISDNAFDFIKDLQTKLNSGLKNKISISLSPLKKEAYTLPYKEEESQCRLHSEVISLLGPEWGDGSDYLIKSLEKLMSRRPHKGCFIAAQQLGGVASYASRDSTSFIHRNAIWKPWINAAWEAGDDSARKRSLDWLEEGWGLLESVCPGVHLAQLHSHLPWHNKTINSAFQEWLPGLKKLKSTCDPQSILPDL